VNCWVPLGATVALDGVTEIDCKATTVSVVVPVTLPDEAEMVVVPPVNPDARPELLTLATVPLDEVRSRKL
jgi:hypothetical protein